MKRDSVGFVSDELEQVDEKLPKVRNALRSITDQVTADEASAIVDVARLAASADGITDPDELDSVVRLSRVVYEMAGVTEVPSPTISIDQARLLDIGNKLERMGPRELAFAGAILIAVEGGVSEREDAFIDQLAEALVLENARARELAGIVHGAIG